MINYLLLLHIFQTTSVNARWGQPWLIQPQSFRKQVLLFMISCIPIKTWMWTNSGYQLPSILSKGKSVKFQRG